MIRRPDPAGGGSVDFVRTGVDIARVVDLVAAASDTGRSMSVPDDIENDMSTQARSDRGIGADGAAARSAAARGPPAPAGQLLGTQRQLVLCAPGSPRVQIDGATACAPTARVSRNYVPV